MGCIAVNRNGNVIPAGFLIFPIVRYFIQWNLLSVMFKRILIAWLYIQVRAFHFLNPISTAF